MTDTFSRRTFIATASFALAGAASALRASEPVTFTFAPRAYPLLLPGETVEASQRIRNVEAFQPLFGARRTAVNPAEPAVRNARTLVFKKPGEYYLRVNGSPLRALVFAPDEGLPASLLRLFDFCVANNLYVGLEDNVFYRDRPGYLRTFFTSERPTMLFCGPTHQFFRHLVADRFCLPSRIVTGPGTFYAPDGSIVRRTHNVPEIYIPDFDKYVFMDLNNGFVPLWLDALELAAASRVWGDVSTADDLDALGIPVHVAVETHHAAQRARELMKEHGSEGTIEFDASLVDAHTVDSRRRARGVRAFYGGAAYWGRGATFAQPTGTEFLDGEYHYASLHRDVRLRDDAIAYVKPWIANVTIDDPDVLRAALREGHRDAIAQREWLARFPH